tara:strand:+ start:2390 stop:4960 length:2571 start_codon:yes stop_codon:yes gene_type:complete
MQHQLKTLDNKLQTLFVNMPGSSSASVQIWFRAGSALESGKDLGIAHFLEHMFFKGTPKRPGAMIAHDVESFGGEINAFTSFDYTCYYINCPNPKLDTTIKILMDMVSNPMFKQDDLVPERDVVFEEFRRSIDSPNQYAFSQIQKNSFTGGYAHQILGEEKTIKAFTQDQLKDFRQKYYNLTNAMLVIAGDIDHVGGHDKVANIVQQFKLPEGPASVFPKFKLNAKSTIDVHEKETRMATLTVSIQAPNVADATSPAEDLALNCLGHGESSRLHRQVVVEKSLANSCSCSTMFMTDGGVHFMRLSLPVENLAKARDRVIATFKDAIENGFDEKELRKIKNQYIASKVYDMESLESYAFSLGHGHAQFGDIGSEEEFIRRIKQVTKSQVDAALSSILSRSIHFSLQVPKGTDVKKCKADLEKFKSGFEKLSKVKTKSKISGIKGSKFDQQVKLVDLVPGVKLLHRYNPMNPTFVMHSYIRGGLAEETAKNNGIYHTLAGVITKGYKGQAYEALKDDMEDMSASLSAFSGKNAYGLTLHGQSEHFTQLLGHFSGTLLKPNLPNKFLAHEKKIALRHLDNQKEDPIKVCFQKASANLFNGHPYSMNALGTVKSIKAIKTDDLLKLHNKNLKSKEMLITYCGDAPFEEIYLKVSEALASLKKRVWTKPKSKAYKPKIEDFTFIPFEREQTQIFTAVPTGGMDEAEHTALKIISAHLGGQSSELFVEVRDRQGLCYTAQPIHFTALEGGYWGVYMASGHDKVKPAIAAIRSILDRLRDEGLSKDDFERVKAMIQGQAQINVQTNEDWAGVYSVPVLQGRDLDWYHKNLATIGDITFEDFNKKLKKVLSKKWSTVVVGREFE